MNRFRPESRTWRASWPAHSILWLAVCHWLPTVASAQTWRIEPSARAAVTATNNSGYANNADSGGDIILDIVPRVGFTGRGARFTVDGFVQADSVNYARNTQPNELLPSGELLLNANLVDRWVYLDATAGVYQGVANPYSVVSNGALPTDQLQTTRYRLSPYIDHAFTPSVSLLYRNENVWTRRTGAASAVERRGDYELHGNSASLVQRPEPLGFSLEANQELSKYSNDPTSTLDIASVRAVLNYAADPTLILGAIVGRERAEFALIETRDTIRGIRMRWIPSQRTNLDASVERRFFGNGWNVAWTHRSPFVAMYFNSVKQPSSQPSPFVLQNTGGDLRTLIDAAYTTRYPNPVERAAIVDAAIARLGSTPNAAGAIEVYSEYAQLLSRTTASVVFLGPRSTVTLQAYSRKAEQLQLADSPPPLGAVATVADNHQTGLSLAFNRRLTTTLSVEALVLAEKTKGLGDAAGNSTTSESLRLAASQALSPKTRLLAGGRVQRARLTQFNRATSVETRNSFSEVAGFLGIEHKF